jgi:hypothetical protein
MGKKMTKQDLQNYIISEAKKLYKTEVLKENTKISNRISLVSDETANALMNSIKKEYESELFSSIKDERKKALIRQELENIQSKVRSFVFKSLADNNVLYFASKPQSPEGYSRDDREWGENTHDF